MTTEEIKRASAERARDVMAKVRAGSTLVSIMTPEGAVEVEVKPGIVWVRHPSPIGPAVSDSILNIERDIAAMLRKCGGPSDVERKPGVEDLWLVVWPGGYFSTDGDIDATENIALAGVFSEEMAKATASSRDGGHAYRLRDFLAGCGGGTVGRAILDLLEAKR